MSDPAPPSEQPPTRVDSVFSIRGAKIRWNSDEGTPPSHFGGSTEDNFAVSDVLYVRGFKNQDRMLDTIILERDESLPPGTVVIEAHDPAPPSEQPREGTRLESSGALRTPESGACCRGGGASRQPLPLAVDSVIAAGHRMLNECSHVHDGAKADLSDALDELHEALRDPAPSQLEKDKARVDLAARLEREADCETPPSGEWWNGQPEALLREAASALRNQAKALKAADELARIANAHAHPQVVGAKYPLRAAYIAYHSTRTTTEGASNE